MPQLCQLLNQYKPQGHKENSYTCVSLDIVPLRTCANTSGCGHATPLLYLCNAQQECESSAPSGHGDKEVACRREQGKKGMGYSPPK